MGDGSYGFRAEGLWESGVRYDAFRRLLHLLPAVARADSLRRILAKEALHPRRAIGFNGV